MNLLTEPKLFRSYDPKKNGSLYVDWVDSKTGKPVDDKDVKSRYEKEILSHAGVQLIGKLHLDLY